MLRVLLAIGLSAGLLAAADGIAPSCNMVPGWTQDGAARFFDADNLFEYMDGNAEGYVIYGFQKMNGITCKKGEVTFVVDISDMGNTDFAYGLFTSNRDLREPAYNVGMGGQIVPRRMIFAKGQHYAEIAANPEGDHTAALKEWTAALDKVVPGNSTPPPALAYFPSEKQQSLRLVPESVLGLRFFSRGYMGQYDFGKAFLVMEESPASATGVMEKFKARFKEATPVSLADEAYQATDKYLGRLCVFRKGRYIAGYAVTTEGVDPLALSKEMAAKIQ